MRERCRTGGCPRFNVMKIPSIIALLIGCLMFGQTAFGQEDGQAEAGDGWNIKSWNIQTSVYTRHFDPEPEHNNDQNLIGIELVFENDWLAGVAVFDNSFGQKSQYVFMGKHWQILKSPYWYFKLTGGLLHGYKEPYEDKIPLNGLGIAPAIVPALGFRYKRVFSELNLAGTSAITVTVGFSF